MNNRKLFVIILVSLSLLVFGITIVSTSLNSINDDEQIIEKPADADPSIPQTTGTQVLTEYEVTGLKFSGEVLTCTNLTDYEQVIDLRISNLDKGNISISIGYPFSTTIDLQPDQIKRIDLPLLYGVSSINLSSNEEKLTLQVPPCIVRGGSGGNPGSQSSLSSSTDLRPPPPVPELSTIALTGIGVFSLIFMIRRSKQ
ncbi:MAG: hypothetical protein ACNA7I_00075 [Candidatus Methanoperedens sp.]